MITSNSFRRLFILALAVVSPGMLYPATRSQPVPPASNRPPAISRFAPPAAGNTGSLQQDYGKLPLSFEPNLGQTDARVRFLGRTRGMTVFLTGTEAVMVFRQHDKRDPSRPFDRPPKVRQTAVRMKLVGAANPRQARGLDQQPGFSNYLLGNDPSQWRTAIPQYARVAFESVYPGVDLVCYGNQRRLEYDFVVAPGADPNRVQLAWEGVHRLDLTAAGDLVLRTALGDILQKRPRVYQETGSARVEIAAGYVIAPGNRVGFALARYDRAKPLVIDPLVAYSTYLGGNGYDYGYGIAVDATGAAYVTGMTTSTDFPLHGQIGGILTPSTNAFISKLSPAGNVFLYSTYLGGTTGGNDYGFAIAVDSAGAAYVTGMTTSTTFPVVSPYQATHTPGTAWDAFVSKLTPAGNALTYSTYLGGSSDEEGHGIAVDSAGAAYVTGWTYSSDFPTAAAYQASNRGGYDVFVTKLTPAGNQAAYSTYLGGSGEDKAYAIAVDSAGSAYITGSTFSADYPTQGAYQSTRDGTGDAFITKLTPSGNALVYSTYLGGNTADYGYGIAVDSAGSAYVTGRTFSPDFPVYGPRGIFQSAIAGNTDVFVTKFVPAGNALVYSTFIGGSYHEAAYGIAIDTAGSAYVAGWTQSTDFPTKSAYQADRGGDDGFVAKLSPGGDALAYSTYLGGSANDYARAIAVDAAGGAYVTGYTDSTDYPTTPSPLQGDMYSTDGFVTKLTAGAGAALQFYPIPPCRIADTRSFTGPPSPLGPPSMTAQSSRSFPVLSSPCGIPSSAVAYSLNVSALPLTGYLGYLTIWGSGQPMPIASTLNSWDGRIVANAAFVPAGAGGAVSIYVSHATDVFFDINGYFAPAGPASLEFYPVAPCRIADTRSFTGPPGPLGPPSLAARTSRTFPVRSSICGIPATAVAYALNMSAVPSAGYLGYLTTWGTGQPMPVASTLNSWTGTIVANAAIVPAGTAGSIDIYVSDATDVFFDINGYFAPPGVGGLQYFPVSPCRVADTRSFTGPPGPLGPPSMGAGTSRSFPVLSSSCGIPPSASAYAVNMTAVPTAGYLLYLTTWGTGLPMPVASTLNSWTGTIVPNAALVPAGTAGAISVYVSDPSDVFFDINGYFAP